MEGSKQKGLTLVELSVVSSLLVLVTVFVGTTANRTYHQYKLNAIMTEFQNIVNINHIKHHFNSGIDDIPPVATKGFTVTDKLDGKHSSLKGTIPAGGGLAEKVEPFYSRQVDPLITLYLADPFVSKKMTQ